MLHEILNTINQVAQAMPWDATLYAPVVVVVLAGIKKFKQIHNGELMVWLLLVFSGIAGWVNYMLATNPTDARVIAFNGVVTFIATQPVYKLLLKPAMAFFAREVQKAALLNEIKTAGVPGVQDI